MALDIAAVQAALRADGLDGWLLYDFHGSNPIARAMAGLNGTPKMTTRRWFYFIPTSGAPRGLVHAIERGTLDGLPGEKLVYAGRGQLASGLETLLDGARRIAMEHSPDGNIPYLARVDAGTVDALRARGIDVVSSGDLVQRFEACWDDAALATHRRASAALYRIKDRTFEAIRERVARGTPTNEHDVQSLMVEWFDEEGLASEARPVVAAMENSGNPHYQPQPGTSRAIGRDELVLIDLWGRLAGDPHAVYADITWVCHTGARPSAEQARAFAAIAAARDAAIALVEDAARDGRDLRGWQVDRAARQVLEDAGFGPQILHRTGHSLGTDVHGNGAHLDDYETHDDRRLLPGAGFTVEPGVYFPEFGVRTEVNVFFGDGEALVTGPRQDAIVTLG